MTAKDLEKKVIEKAKELGLSFEGQLSDHEWTCLTFSLH